VARRRRWVVPTAAAAAVVVVAGAGWLAWPRHAAPPHAIGPTDPTASAPVSESPAADTYEAHRAAAQSEAARLLTVVRLPDGATRFDGPAPGNGVGEETVGPSDPELTQTAWWTVPVPPDQVATFLVAHVPDGFRAQPGPSTAHIVSSWIFGQTESPDPTAYEPAFLLLRWKSFGAGTLVRADVFTGAYDVRPAESVLGEVAAVEIAHQPPTSHGENPLRTVDLHAPGDAAAIATLVDAFDALPGSMRPAFAGLCPAPVPGKQQSDTITFHEAGGGVVTATLTPYCFGQVEVARDGVPLHPTLDPGGLATAIKDVLAGT
jgi:hypothetical protein